MQVSYFSSLGSSLEDRGIQLSPLDSSAPSIDIRLVVLAPREVFRPSFCCRFLTQVLSCSELRRKTVLEQVLFAQLPILGYRPLLMAVRLEVFAVLAFLVGGVGIFMLYTLLNVPPTLHSVFPSRLLVIIGALVGFLLGLLVLFVLLILLILLPFPLLYICRRNTVFLTYYSEASVRDNGDQQLF